MRRILYIYDTHHTGGLFAGRQYVKRAETINLRIASDAHVISEEMERGTGDMNGLICHDVVVRASHEEGTQHM